MRHHRKTNKHCFSLLISSGLWCLLLLSACTTLSRNPLPVNQNGIPTVTGMPAAIRSVGLGASKDLQTDFAEAMVAGGRQAECDSLNDQPVFCVLVISGGGGFGAYGAGVLDGWTQSGSRPNFKIVTGVSTGGLIAPFAFLGPAWDTRLKEVFYSIETDKDILRWKSWFKILRSESAATTAPLAMGIERFIDDAVVVAIAAEHKKGRRLYIGTTNLDSQSFTVWNIGAIAQQGGPRALELIRKLLLASASIPIAMPPVFFDVDLAGKQFDEMHADGGVQAQFFVPLKVIDLPKAIQQANELGFDYTPTPRMFIIRNSKFQPDTDPVDRNLTRIAARSIKSMIQSMARSDLNEIYAISQARGTDFQYTEVPDEFIWQSPDKFDGTEMRRLYEIGYQKALGNELWSDKPPGVFSNNIE